MDLTGAEPRERLDPTGRRRDVRLAAACLTGGLVLLSAGVHDHAGGGPMVLAGLIVSCVALLLRRTAPVPAVLIATAAVAVDARYGPSLGTILVFTQVLYDVSVYGRRWVLSWLLRIVVPATVIVFGVSTARGSHQAVPLAVTLTLVLVLPVVTAVPVRQHRERARVERERAELESERAEVERNRAEVERNRAEQVVRLAEVDRRYAVASERTRMARELHDVIANHLSAIALHATAGLALPDLDGERLRGILTVMRDNSVQGLAETRRLVHVLRHSADDDGETTDGPRQPRLADAAELVVDAAGIDARLEIIGSPPAQLPLSVDLAAYRIVQESITNAVKHAAGGTAVVSVEYRPDRVMITVESTCPSIGAMSTATVSGGGMGLIGMRERATLLGGTFTAGARAGTGWRVRAELPVMPTGGTR